MRPERDDGEQEEDPWHAEDRTVLLRLGFLALGALLLVAVSSDALAAGKAARASSTGGVFKYVALGDSFSAGEGLPPFFEPDYEFIGWGDVDCHRSTAAYSTLIRDPRRPTKTLYQEDRRSHVPDTQWGFQACSGATTDAVLTKPFGGDPLAQLSSDRNKDTQNHNRRPVDLTTNLVTITIGGNDMHFPDVLNFCAFSDNCTTEALPSYLTDGTGFPGGNLEAYGTYLRGKLSAKLDAVYAAIAQQAPNAQLLVLGYPQLFPATPAEQNCGKIAQRTYHNQNPFGKAIRTIGFSPTEQNAFRREESRVNQLIAARVQASQGTRPRPFATFIPVDQAFAGHEICGDNGEWINAPTLSLYDKGASLKSFHPNLKGQTLGYAATINDYLKRPILTASTTLPNATAGTPYSTTLDVRGGVPPYTWTPVNGTLPAGLTLDTTNGIINGTPTTPATTTFTLRVKDQYSPTTATSTYTLTVNQGTTGGGPSSAANAISAGGYHSCALRTSGTSHAGASTKTAALGNGSTTNSSVPVAVSGITNATQITAGGFHSCALLTGGQVDCWGDNTLRGAR